MNFKTILPVLLLAMTMNVFAQKDKSKEVKTRYLSVPPYDITETDPSTITAEFAIGETTFGTEKLKDTKTMCVPKNGGIKDVIEVTSYYYEIPISTPESYLVAKTPSGDIVYASEVSHPGKSVAKFGFEKCEYWMSDNMKKDWASKGAGFKSGEKSNHEAEMHKKAVSEAKAKVYLSFVEEEFEVYSAKGKGFDYTGLEGALEKAQKAYADIAKSGPSEAAFALLKECTEQWEKDLADLDTENKKARINKTIGKGLHENCARAYMYVYDIDKAIEHGKKFDKLFGNVSTNRSKSFDALMVRMKKQKIAAEMNSALIADVSAFVSKANASSKGAVKVAKLGSSDVARLKKELLAFRSTQRTDQMATRKKEEDAAIASGELNPYQKYVVPGVGGPAIMMTMAPSVLSGFPELSELPKKMCAIEGLTQIIIMNNNIESIPAEIGSMASLNKLDLTGNKLKTLPAEIGQLANLKTLKLGKNPIESLPAEIANCKNLKTLTLKGSKLSAAAQDELAAWLPNCKIKY